MNSKHFIITGTSRGIGEQLAKMLLEQDHFVYGVSRGTSKSLDIFQKYNHFYYDLSEVLGIDSLLNGIFERIKQKSGNMICLVNNAAMLEPMKRIDQCTAEEINKSLQISLIAPMILTFSFIKQSNNFQIRRKIINISSGSGTYAAPEMSVYCTAKAGINMFTQCVGAEQLGHNNPVEIVAVDPGMVETEMQVAARGKNEEDFLKWKNSSNGRMNRGN